MQTVDQLDLPYLPVEEAAFAADAVNCFQGEAVAPVVGAVEHRPADT